MWVTVTVCVLVWFFVLVFVTVTVAGGGVGIEGGEVGTDDGACDCGPTSLVSYHPSYHKYKGTYSRNALGVVLTVRPADVASGRDSRLATSNHSQRERMDQEKGLLSRLRRITCRSGM